MAGYGSRHDDPDDTKGHLSGPSRENADIIVPILQGYAQEAEEARRGGMNPRDAKWEENLHLYWNRVDHSRKAEWQARETMPEVPAFVDRLAAALKEALVTGPEGFYTVVDPADSEGDMTPSIKRMTDAWLSTCGRNQTGTCLGFPAVFEEQCKMGALMGACSTTTWKEDVKYGRVSIDTVDPRTVWLDPTHRNLYRRRRVELDKHELMAMALQHDRKGKPIFNVGEIAKMVSHIEYQDHLYREQMTGHSSQQSSTRQPITMDEWIATVVDNTGKVVAKDALMVVGNNQFLIRGPEPNPYWHGTDWLVFSPLVVAPLSVYGRTYMEDFGSVANTFNKLTNLLLDAVYMSSMKAFAIVPEMLVNPGQLAGGITPNKLFQLQEGVEPKQFMASIDLGQLPPESLQMWQQIKNELREAADMNEVGLGQFAPKSRTSATEIQGAEASSSAVIRSLAQTLETRYLQPTLDLVWKTGLQHVKTNDLAMRSACGPEMFDALMKRRRELIARPITFQARGISTLIQKQKMLRALLQLMQYLAQRPEMLAAFMEQIDMSKFLKLLFDLSDVDVSKVTISEREKTIRQAMQAMNQGAQQNGAAGMQPGGQASAEMGEVAQQMGVAR